MINRYYKLDWLQLLNHITTLSPNKWVITLIPTMPLPTMPREYCTSLSTVVIFLYSLVHITCICITHTIIKSRFHLNSNLKSAFSRKKYMPSEINVIEDVCRSTKIGTVFEFLCFNVSFTRQRPQFCPSPPARTSNEASRGKLCPRSGEIRSCAGNCTPVQTSSASPGSRGRSRRCTSSDHR